MRKKIIFHIILLVFLSYLISYISWHVLYGSKNITKEVELQKQYQNKLIAFKKYKTKKLELVNNINHLNSKHNSDLLEEYIKKNGFITEKEIVISLDKYKK